MSVTSIVDSLFSILHYLTAFIRDLINKASPDYSVLILVLLSGVGSYFLVRKLNEGKISEPVISGYWVYGLIGLLLFMLLRFV